MNNYFELIKIENRFYTLTLSLRVSDKQKDYIFMRRDKTDYSTILPAEIKFFTDYTNAYNELFNSARHFMKED